MTINLNESFVVLDPQYLVNFNFTRSVIVSHFLLSTNYMLRVMNYVSTQFDFP